MKYIEKQKQEPEVCIKWRKNGGWDASAPDSKSFNQKAWELKQKVKEYLLREQGSICCYCEEQISVSEHSSHIEHLLPKGNPKYASIKSDYKNLFCSCSRGDSCGHAKNNSEIGTTPSMKDCEEYFEYKDDGRIKGKSKDADSTISILKLDCERLNSARNEVISVLLYAVPDVTLSEYDSWIQDYLEQDDKGCFRRFWSVVKFIAQKYRSCYE
jgi:uncharacterized protein (TIGR02646 family)